MFDGKAFGKEMVDIVKAHVAKTVAPLLLQIDALKSEIDALKAAPAPKDGKSITVEDVAPLIETAITTHVEAIERMVPDAVKAAVASIPIPQAPVIPDIPALVDAAVKALPPAQDGKDADPEQVASLVAETVERAVAALPVAQDGKSITIDDVRPLIDEAVTKAVTLITVKDGIDGKSVTIDDVAPMILSEVENAVSVLPIAIAQTVQDEVAKLPQAPAGKDADPAIIKQMVTEAVAALPSAKDGKDGATIEELWPIIDETVSKAVSVIPIPKDGKDGRDGVDVKDLLVVEGGELVATFTDGRTKALGPFRGKDGASGEPGKNGIDGLGFEDMTEELADDGRTIVRRYTRGDQTKEFRHTISVVLDRGVFKEGQTYQAGDGVTWGGSFWIAQEETTEKPDTGKGFRLAVKRGRAGKDGIVRTVNEKPVVKVGG